MDTQRYQDIDVRAMLLDLGVGRYLTDMIIPKAWFLVGTTDPDDSTVIEMVKAIQRGLRKLGYRSVLESGVIDQQTAHALNQVSGPGWVQKSWIQVMSDVLNGVYNPGQKRLEMKMARSARRAQGMGSYFEYEGEPPGPLPGYKVGLPPGPLGGLGATADNEGVTLTYGKGISNPKNMVPVDDVTRSAFKNVQRQLNRNLSVIGKRVSEDGVIGEGTRQGILSLKGRLKKHPIAIPALSVTTETMAYKAVSLGRMLKAEADALGVASGANVSSAPSTPKDTTDKPISSGAGMVSGVLGMAQGFLPWILLAGGVTAGAVYWRRKKGKR